MSKKLLLSTALILSNIYLCNGLHASDDGEERKGASHTYSQPAYVPCAAASMPSAASSSNNASGSAAAPLVGAGSSAITKASAPIFRLPAAINGTILGMFEDFEQGLLAQTCKAGKENVEKARSQFLKAYVKFTKIDEPAIPILNKYQKIELHIGEPDVPINEVIELINRLTNSNIYMYISGAGASDAGVIALSQMPNIRNIKGLSFYTNDPKTISDVGMDAIAKFTGLEELNIPGIKVTQDGKKISNTNITSAGIIRNISSLPNLKSLEMGGLDITDEVIFNLTHLNLTYLNLEGAKITSKGVEAISQFSNLTFLNLDRVIIDSQGISHLAHLNKLEDLWLNECGLTDAAMKVVGQLDRLRCLQLRGNPKISSEKLRYIGNLRKLEGLWLNECGLKEGLRHLPNPPKLIKDLDLAGCGLTDASMEVIGQLDQLEWLVLDNNPEISSEGLTPLKKLRKLDNLWLQRCGLTYAAMTSIGQIASLRQLYLSDNPNISNIGLRHLRRLPNLKDIFLNGTQATVGPNFFKAKPHVEHHNRGVVVNEPDFEEEDSPNAAA